MTDRSRPDEPERVVIRDKRRIDPVTGEVRHPDPDPAADRATSAGPPLPRRRPIERGRARGAHRRPATPAGRVRQLPQAGRARPAGGRRARRRPGARRFAAGARRHRSGAGARRSDRRVQGGRRPARHGVSPSSAWSPSARSAIRSTRLHEAVMHAESDDVTGADLHHRDAPRLPAPRSPAAARHGRGHRSRRAPAPHAGASGLSRMRLRPTRAPDVGRPRCEAERRSQSTDGTMSKESEVTHQ